MSLSFVSRIAVIATIAPALTTFVAAQAIKTVPKQYDKKEGGGSSEAPGDWRPVHMQCIYSKDAIANGIGLVKSISYRAEQNKSYAANSRQLKVELSTKGVPKPEFSSAIYAGNRGTDHRVVFSGTLNLPAVQSAAGPRPFNVTIPLNSPFVYTLATNVCIELTVTGSSFKSDGWRADATPGIVVSPSGTAVNIGSGCPTSFRISSQGNVPWPGALAIFRGTPGITSQAPFFLVIGANALNVDLTGAGAPGCRLYQDLAIVLPGVTQANGNILLNFGKLPESSSLRGANVPMQAFVLDRSFNRFGFRASAGYAMTLGRGFPVGLEAHAWYDRRDNTSATFTQADFRSTRTPIFQFN